MKTAFKKQLSKMIGKIEEMNENISLLKGEIEDICSETLGDFENKSEKWQEGEKGQDEQQKIDALENLSSSLDEATGCLDSVLSDLQELTPED